MNRRHTAVKYTAGKFRTEPLRHLIANYTNRLVQTTRIADFAFLKITTD